MSAWEFQRSKRRSDDMFIGSMRQVPPPLPPPPCRRRLALPDFFFLSWVHTVALPTCCRRATQSHHSSRSFASTPASFPAQKLTRRVSPAACDANAQACCQCCCCLGFRCTQSPHASMSPCMRLPLTSPHLTSPHLTSPHVTSRHVTSPHLTSPHVTSPHLTSPHVTSPHLTSPHVTSRHTSDRLRGRHHGRQQR
jgi:hypothetical protein